MNMIASIAVALIVFVISLFAVVTGIWSCFKIRRIASWPAAQGRVIWRGVGYSKRAVAVGPPAFRFEAKVSYQYEVGGKIYEGHSITLATRLGTKKDAYARVMAIPDAVKVYYNPSRPEESYLGRDSLWFPVFFIIFGVPMLTLSFLYLVGIILPRC